MRLAVEHGGSKADDEDREVGEAYSVVVRMAPADYHAVQRNRRYRQAAQAVPHLRNISAVLKVALAPINVAAHEPALRPKVSSLRNGPPLRVLFIESEAADSRQGGQTRCRLPLAHGKRGQS